MNNIDIKRVCVAHLITHSKEFDNEKVTSDMYRTSSIPLTNSYITRDIFLIPVDEIDMSKVYGELNLEVLKNKLEY